MANDKTSNYSLIHISGADSEKFLQGQLTCDVRQLNTEPFLFAAHCSPKGRVISLFRIFKQADDFYLLMPTDVIETAFENLNKYARFFKTTLTVLSSDQRKGYPFDFDDATQHHQDVIQGIPCLHPNTIGEFLPHYINLPQFGGVSFSKGCYTGQEIIARMEHRGNLKQHMVAITLDKKTEPGEKVIFQEQTLGVCVDTTQTIERKFVLLVIMADKLLADYQDIINH